MSLLISTPMFGAMCTAEYFKSCLDLRGSLVISNVLHDWLVTDNESLITRARNTSVARFMFDKEYCGYDRFMFIDADIEFTAQDVMELWNMDVDVATAAYRQKKEGSCLSAWMSGEQAKLESLEGMTENVEVDYAGTGFLMIKRHVFEKMAEAYPELRHKEGNVGEVYAFFDTGVTGTEYPIDLLRYCEELIEDVIGGKDFKEEYLKELLERIECVTTDKGWEDKFYCSEDYAFCERARNDISISEKIKRTGFKIMLNPEIRLGHVGRRIFK